MLELKIEPMLSALVKQKQEYRYIKEVIESHAGDSQTAIIPWIIEMELSQKATPESDAA